MRISKEQFSKLSQLDRIEYRQDCYAITKDTYSFSQFEKLFWTGFTLIIFAFVMDIWLMLHGGDGLRYSLFHSLLRLWLIMSAVGLVLDFMGMWAESCSLNRLNSKYFKIETIKKKRK